MKPTKGPWKIDYRFPGSYAIEPDVAWLGASLGRQEGENLANAELIAEAGTIYHETGLTPREILAQRDELLRASARLDWARRNLDALDVLHPKRFAAQVELENATNNFSILRKDIVAGENQPA